MTIANWITSIRIICIPFLIIAFYLPISERYLLSAIIFGMAAITDWLDGYLARYLNQISPLGILLDPIADKLMVVTGLILLMTENQSPWFVLPTILIICREIIVCGLRAWASNLNKRNSMNVSVLGKAKTIFQMVAILLMFITPFYPSIFLLRLAYITLHIATLLTIVSLGFYIHSIRRILE